MEDVVTNLAPTKYKQYLYILLIVFTGIAWSITDGLITPTFTLAVSTQNNQPPEDGPAQYAVKEGLDLFSFFFQNDVLR